MYTFSLKITCISVRSARSDYTCSDAMYKTTQLFIYMNQHIVECYKAHIFNFLPVGCFSEVFFHLEFICYAFNME